MPEIQTGLANIMDAAEAKARLDATAKKLIKHKVVLAEILKECVEEFEGYEIKYIEQNCFDGEVKVSEISVDQDIPDADSSIVGSDTEDNSKNEGLVRYDLVFTAIVPKTREKIRLVINVEIQVDTELSYAIVTRGVYYAARLISRQKGTVFEHMDYDKIQKVYSIWICPDPNKENVNSIAEYGFTQQKVIGKVSEPVENYDKMKVIIISLNDDGMENESGIIRLLSTLLSTKETVEKRKQILESEFNIPMTKEINEEVLDMCNFGTAIEISGIKKGRAQGKAEGIEETLLESVKNLMETLGLSAQQAMNALKISEADQARLLTKLGQLS